MINSLQKSHLVDEAVSLFTNERVSKMKTESTENWYLSVWDTLVINDKPPREEFESKLKELIDAQPLKELRTKRNTLLDQTDKYIVADWPHPTSEARQAWIDYRQALRDLPANTEDPENPIWPRRPDEVVDTEFVTEAVTETTETSNTEAVTETTETSNTEAVTETTETSNTEAVTETTETSNTEAVTETTETSNTETVTETTEASNTEAVTETTEASNTETVTETTETSNTEAVTETTETSNTEAVTETTETSNTEAVTETTETSNTEAVTETTETVTETSTN